MMKAIADHLEQQGENTQLKNNTVEVKFSLFISKLVIRKDLASNRLTYSYNQFGDFIAIIIMSFISGNFMTQNNFPFAMLCIGWSLAMVAGCIIKELKVSVIKQQINALIEKHPEILTTKLQRLPPSSVTNSI